MHAGNWFLTSTNCISIDGECRPLFWTVTLVFFRVWKRLNVSLVNTLLWSLSGKPALRFKSSSATFSLCFKTGAPQMWVAVDCVLPSPSILLSIFAFCLTAFLLQDRILLEAFRDCHKVLLQCNNQPFRREAADYYMCKQILHVRPYKVSQEPVSIHVPLSRLLAGGLLTIFVWSFFVCIFHQLNRLLWSLGLYVIICKNGLRDQLFDKVSCSVMIVIGFFFWMHIVGVQDSIELL